MNSMCRVGIHHKLLYQLSTTHILRFHEYPDRLFLHRRVLDYTSMN